MLVREDGPAAHVTLNRPGKRNALSFELMEELTATLTPPRRRVRACARS